MAFICSGGFFVFFFFNWPTLLKKKKVCSELSHDNQRLWGSTNSQSFLWLDHDAFSVGSTAVSRRID